MYTCVCVIENVLIAPLWRVKMRQAYAPRMFCIFYITLTPGCVAGRAPSLSTYSARGFRQRARATSYSRIPNERRDFAEGVKVSPPPLCVTSFTRTAFMIGMTMSAPRARARDYSYMLGKRRSLIFGNTLRGTYNTGCKIIA